MREDRLNPLRRSGNLNPLTQQRAKKRRLVDPWEEEIYERLLKE